MPVAALPSPGSNELVLGPLNLRFYGLAIALGVLAAVWLARRRWADRGGDPEDMSGIALWAVPAGLVGARLYHVATDWKQYFPDRPVEALYLWQGGLGIPGGIAAGVAVGLWVARRYGIRLPTGLDVVAPALPLAQAIGRLGNWFNQELFGRPTDLPWGLAIDPANRPAGYEAVETFHPTFLYEALWNLALVVVLITVDRRRVLRPGNLFALYVGGYFLGRLWVEALRIDTASRVLGVRINIWTSLVVVVAVVAVLAVRGLRRRPDEPDGPYLDGHVATETSLRE
jgi:prolipoprotein diacylglyceryl transferase